MRAIIILTAFRSAEPPKKVKKILQTNWETLKPYTCVQNRGSQVLTGVSMTLKTCSPECPAWHMEKYPKDLPRRLPLPKGTNKKVSNMVEISAITGQENCCQIKTTRHDV